MYTGGKTFGILIRGLLGGFHEMGGELVWEPAHHLGKIDLVKRLHSKLSCVSGSTHRAIEQRPCSAGVTVVSEALASRVERTRGPSDKRERVSE